MSHLPSQNVCVAALCFLFPNYFGGGEDLEKSGSICCMEKSLALCLSVKKKNGQEPSSIGWSASSSLMLLLPTGCICHFHFCCHFHPLLVTPTCPLVCPAVSGTGSLKHLWFFSSSFFCLQLLTLSLPSLSFTHSSYKKSVLITSCPATPPGTLTASSVCLSPTVLHIIWEWWIYWYYLPSLFSKIRKRLDIVSHTL